MEEYLNNSADESEDYKNILTGVNSAFKQVKP